MKPISHHRKTMPAVRRSLASMVLLVAACAGSGAAFAQSPPGHAGMPGMAGMAKEMHKGDAKGAMQMQMVMETTQKKMAGMKMTGQADTDFAMMMVVHHQGAIDMAKAELASGSNAEMRQTATKVIADQTEEIAKLEAWLKKIPAAK